MTDFQVGSYELGPIRPPNEAYSLLVRVTCNCPWNRCKFCPIYKNDKFQLRSVDDIKQDIVTARAIYDKILELAGNSLDSNTIREVAARVYHNSPSDACRNVALWMYAGSKNAFLQDANSLIMKTPGLVEVIRFLKETFPNIERITSYARSHTAARKSVEELVSLREAGLSRLHIGMESGNDAVLAFMDKGVTAADHLVAGKNVKAAGITLSEYVMPGAGGKKLWREHAVETARLLNQINPDIIRLRTLTIQPRMLLYKDVVSGEFVRSTDEEIVKEIKVFLENLDCTSQLFNDHMMNLLPEIEGKLPDDKKRFLEVIRNFQSLSPRERDIYKLGRRLAIYDKTKDLDDPTRRIEVERVLGQISHDELNEVLFKLMERYV